MQIQKKAVDLTDLAIGIIVLGVITTIGVKILLTQRDSRLTDLDKVTTYDEGVTQSSAVKLTHKWGSNVNNVTNATTGTLISSGNYTVTISDLDGTITINNATSTYTGLWNVTYTWYNTSRADWTLADDASTGIAEYGNWFKTIVIVGVAAVVLALIFMAFGKSSVGGSVSGGSY